jgi:hypothetical protein
MCIRAYLLLQTSENTSQEIVDALLEKPGVVTADLLEGLPNLILVIEAERREELAGYIIRALDLVEFGIQDLRFFIGRESHQPILTAAAALK